MSTERKKIFYGWLVVISCWIMLFFGTGVVTMTAGQFVKPVCKVFGFTRGQFTLYLSMMTLALIILTPQLKRFYKKYNPRVLMVVGGIIMIASWFCMSLAKYLWQFYILGFTIGCGLMFVSSVTSNILLNNWFIEKKGTAMGLAMLGLGVGSATMNPLAAKLIVNYGYAAAYQIIAAIMLVGFIPVWILARFKPEDMGLKPLGWETRTTVSGAPAEIPGTLYKDAIRTPAFWGICIMAVFMSSAAQGVFTQVPAYLNDIGISPLEAAKYVSILAIASAIGKAFWGWMNDKIGAKPNFTLALIVYICSLLTLFFMHIPNMPYLFAVLFGLGMAEGTLLIPLIIINVFGPKDFVAIYGLVVSFFYVGPTIAPPFSGFIFDITGNYMAAFIVYLCALVITFILGVNLIKSRKPKNINTIEAK